MTRLLALCLVLLAAPVTAQTTFFEDAFTGTPGVQLGGATSTSGHVWNRHPSGGQEFRYDSSGARVHIDNQWGGSTTIPAVTPPSADYEVTCTLRVLTSTQVQYPACSARNTTTGTLSQYVVFYDTTTDLWNLEVVVNGATTANLGSYSQALANATTYAVTLIVIGSSLTVEIDGVQRIPTSGVATDTQITAAGVPGIGDYHDDPSTDTTMIHFDHITATTIAPGVAPTGFLLDTITGSDGWFLNDTTSTSGHEWNYHPANANSYVFTDFGDHVHLPTASGYTVNVPFLTAPDEDYQVECVFYVHTISASEEVMGCGLRTRPAAPIHLYQIVYRTSLARWEIEFADTTGVYTTIGNYPQVLTPGVSYTGRLTALGTGLTVHINGISRISITHATITDAGTPSLNGYTVTAQTGTTGIHIASIEAASATVPVSPTAPRGLMLVGVGDN